MKESVGRAAPIRLSDTCDTVGLPWTVHANDAWAVVPDASVTVTVTLEVPMCFQRPDALYFAIAQQRRGMMVAVHQGIRLRFGTRAATSNLGADSPGARPGRRTGRTRIISAGPQSELVGWPPAEFRGQRYVSRTMLWLAR